MKKSLLFLISISAISCSGDDDNLLHIPYDAENPIVGVWQMYLESDLIIKLRDTGYVGSTMVFMDSVEVERKETPVSNQFYAFRPDHFVLTGHNRSEIISGQGVYEVKNDTLYYHDVDPWRAHIIIDISKTEFRTLTFLEEIDNNHIKMRENSFSRQ